jgi:XTP/dITP diphosphohydrolase
MKPDGVNGTMRDRAKVILATHNAHKVAEFQAMLPEIELLSAANVGLPEPEETGHTFQENALIKALAAARATALPALADDSGIAVRGLDGAPGIYSARWAGTGGNFAPAMQRIIDELGRRSGGFANADRHAAFVASLCLAFPDGIHQFFDGIVEGEIVEIPRGESGFGYDPIFLPAGQTRTFGEMPAAEKNAQSHRARAIALLRAWLDKPSQLRERLDHGT